jgi:hypothetical protein
MGCSKLSYNGLRGRLAVEQYNVGAFAILLFSENVGSLIGHSRNKTSFNFAGQLLPGCLKQSLRFMLACPSHGHANVA